MSGLTAPKKTIVDKVNGGVKAIVTNGKVRWEDGTTKTPKLTELERLAKRGHFKKVVDGNTITFYSDAPECSELAEAV